MVEGEGDVGDKTGSLDYLGRNVSFAIWKEGLERKWVYIA